MTADEQTAHTPDATDPALAERIQNLLLGEAPSMTRLDLAERTGADQAVAQELWRQLGFPRVPDSDIAFTSSDETALRYTNDLIRAGILSPESQAALVRTLARSFARLAEWQTRLLHEIGDAVDVDDDGYIALIGEILPRIEILQNYVWRRHLASASAAVFTTEDSAAAGERLAICFVDIVGYTSRSKSLDEGELIDWVERFEADVTGIVVDHGGQVIKTIGDEVMFVVDGAEPAAEIGLALAARGRDDDAARGRDDDAARGRDDDAARGRDDDAARGRDDDAARGRDDDKDFPAVRVGISYGNVVRRLGDVFGPTVNIAARLTSVARPGTVVVDRGIHDVLCHDHAPEETRSDKLMLRRLPPTRVKGYSRLDCWAVRRPKSRSRTPA